MPQGFLFRVAWKSFRRLICLFLITKHFRTLVLSLQHHYNTTVSNGYYNDWTINTKFVPSDLFAIKIGTSCFTAVITKPSNYGMLRLQNWLCFPLKLWRCIRDKDLEEKIFSLNQISRINLVLTAFTASIWDLHFKTAIGWLTYG